MPAHATLQITSQRARDHVPPLLRGLGFALVLVTSLVVAMLEQQADTLARDRIAQLRTQTATDAVLAGTDSEPGEITRELRYLRQQLQNQEDDLADRIFENLWFQLLGTLGTALVAVSFFYEAALKWPRSIAPARTSRDDD